MIPSSMPNMSATMSLESVGVDTISMGEPVTEEQPYCSVDVVGVLAMVEDPPKACNSCFFPAM